MRCCGSTNSILYSTFYNLGDREGSNRYYQFMFLSTWYSIRYRTVVHLWQSFKKSRKSLNPLLGCVGVIDGIAIKIEKPRNANNASRYYCRKVFYALPEQAMCDDGRYRLFWFSCLSIGSSHDSLVLELSRLGDWMKEVQIPHHFGLQETKDMHVKT